MRLALGDIMRSSAVFKLTTLFVIVPGFLLITFQNCSPVAFYDMESEAKAYRELQIKIGADEETVTAGLNEVPDLNLVFVVDNSGTMKQNQLNLSDSFGTMFDASSVSLNKFKSSTYLINTAQTAPVFSSDKTTYDRIASQQASFDATQNVTKAIFDVKYRTATQNTGLIPGDNLGYSLKKSVNPLSYQIKPAMVLGTTEAASGDYTFNNSIKKDASSDVTAVENEFKKRLAIMSSDRLPQVFNQSLGRYTADYSSIIDGESGLCSVARILRNPDGYFKPGELVSFTIVSDENDNDPSGSKCIQSATQLNGTEDLVDIECKRNSTDIKYSPPVQNIVPDKCKLNGNIGYNFEFSYTSASSTTTSFEYKNIKNNDIYTAKYYTLKYKKAVPGATTYKYTNTKVVYYINQCFPIYSDGTLVGERCDPKSAPEAPAYEPGVYNTSDATCMTLASNKSANKALSSPKPVCTLEDMTVTSCNTADPLCKPTTASTTYVYVSPITFPGNKPSDADCATQAGGYADYANTPVCASADVGGLANCDGRPTASLCAVTTPYAEEWLPKSVSGDKRGDDSCLTEAQKYSNITNLTSSQVRNCEFTETAGTAKTKTGSVNFYKNSAWIDGGTQLNAGDDCGVIKADAYAVVSGTTDLKSTDACVIKSIKAAAETTVNKPAADADCAPSAATRCTNDHLRTCTGTFVQGSNTTVPASTPTLFKNVTERITCASKCGDSVLGLCDAGTASATTVAQFLKDKYGAVTTCSNTSTVGAVERTLTMQLVAQEASACLPTAAGIPTYNYRKGNVYRSQANNIDYVAGTMKDANNKDVPAMSLINYIKSRVAYFNTNQFVFTALVQKSSDPVPTIGSRGVEYERLMTETGGQVESIRSADYSVALKDLSRIIKNSIERMFVVKKMRADQIITKVTLIKKDTDEQVVLSSSDWTQNANAVQIHESFEFVEGDKFKIDFQNDYVP